MKRGHFTTGVPIVPLSSPLTSIFRSILNTDDAQRFGIARRRKAECTTLPLCGIAARSSSLPNVWILESVCWWQNPAWMDMIAAPR